MTRLGLVLPVALALAGCIEEERTPPDEAAAQDACGAEPLQDLVGQPFAADLLPGGDGTVRVIRPDTAVTMDHRPDRLNVLVDESGTITEIRCG